MTEESDFDKGYKAGRRMMAMRVRHHVSPEGAQYVRDVIGEYGGPEWPPSDSQVTQNATRAKAHGAGVEAERKRWVTRPAFLEIKSGDLSPEAVKRINDFVESMKGGVFNKVIVIEEEERCRYCGDPVTQLTGMTCPRYDCHRCAQVEAEGVTEEDMARDPADVSTMRGTDR